MTGLVRSAVTTVLAVALTATVGWSGVGVAAATPTGAVCIQPQTPAPRFQDGQPVVFVHGWTGEPMDAMAEDVKEAIPDIAPYTFDYERWGAYWANDGRVAACLADYVHAVAEATDEPVILVAHSMGGLAIRYAYMPQYATRPLTAEVAPEVITLGTPYNGSPFGGSYLGMLFEGLKQASEMVDPQGDATGKRCLVVRSGGEELPRGCGELPDWLPAGVGLTAIAGEITFIRKMFLWDLYEMPIGGDGIVPTMSANGYLQSGPGDRPPARSHDVDLERHSCTADSHAMTAAVLAGGNPIFAAARFTAVLKMDEKMLDDFATDRTGRFSAELAAFGMVNAFHASCGHVGITAHGESLAYTVDTIERIISEINPHQETENVTLRPVGSTSGSTLNDGWSIVESNPEAVMCNAVSLHAVEPGVGDCFPLDTASNCWYFDLAGMPRAACLIDPIAKTLRMHEMGRAGSLDPVPDPDWEPYNPWPLYVELADGTTCRFTRELEAWEPLADKPSSQVLYPCTPAADGSQQAIFTLHGDGSLNGSYTDVFLTGATRWNDRRWRVQIGEPGGTEEWRAVARAFYLGNGYLVEG